LRLPKLDWFCSNEHRLPGNTDMYAAKSGSLRMLEFVLSKKQRPPRFSVNLMAAAAAHGPPEVGTPMRKAVPGLLTPAI
jgi:hypothetical protein